MILARLMGLIAPFLSAIAVILAPSLAILLWMATAENARLERDLAAAEASLALSRANADRLQGALDRQSAAIAALHNEGEARRSATAKRLKAFPDAALPAEWGSPLTGATTCDRAVEVMDRFIGGLK